MDTFHLLPYDPSWEERWDRFVMEGSMNGTFLQTRRFLSYHPQGRFEDVSLMVLDGQELVAVCPAAAQTVNGVRMLRSHPGSTFGGLVVSSALLRAPRLVTLMEQLDMYWRGQGFGASELKLTSDLFSTQPTDVLQYVLYHAGYTDELEIAAYVPIAGRTHEELVAAYSFNKRYDLKKCVKTGLSDRPLHTQEELAAFYDLLCENLKKFDATPVHTLAELVDFHDVRLSDEVRFLGVFTPEGKMVAGACLFWFCQARVLHTQYLATAPLKGCVPSTYLYDSVIRAGMSLGAKCVSFGTSTHDRGRVLNTGLIQNKEGYGSLHSLNRIYTKVYREE
ncbi:MAG: GNAT family N-acetyltransferase [Candidatus Limiplasma sp.]|nr:GNAT family N-acetyltransferase [Candidatus Limiplasma sp.]